MGLAVEGGAVALSPGVGTLLQELVVVVGEELLPDCGHGPHGEVSKDKKGVGLHRGPQW